MQAKVASVASVDGEVSEESSSHRFRQRIGQARRVKRENGPRSKAMREPASDMGRIPPYM